MDPRAGRRVGRGSRRLRHGCCGLQSQMGICIPRHSPLHLQRPSKQLVERPLRSPPARFPQVGVEGHLSRL